jgi:hypothetical protein
MCGICISYDTPLALSYSRPAPAAAVYRWHTSHANAPSLAAPFLSPFCNLKMRIKKEKKEEEKKKKKTKRK